MTSSPAFCGRSIGAVRQWRPSIPRGRTPIETEWHVSFRCALYRKTRATASEARVRWLLCLDAGTEREVVALWRCDLV